MNASDFGGSAYGTPPPSRYWALRDHLQRQSRARLELTFGEIEAIIGKPLPPSAYAPRWWIIGKNTRHSPLWQESWRSAGYDATLILGTDRVEFRRLT